jgi:histidinol-phosphate aminotransferase
LTPSYSLYPVLADIHGAKRSEVSLRRDFGLPEVAKFERDAALTFITTPNAPSGRGYTTKELEALCRHLRGVVVLDETYVDFADENAMELGLKFPHVIISRTFSKAYSLCFQRVGYYVGPPDLIAALDKIRDSYNVNGLGQVAALATLRDLPYYRKNFKKIRATREWLTTELGRVGFETLPSQTNFLFTRPPKFAAEKWLGELRARKVLVRWFNYPETRDFLRITIGTEREAAALVSAVKKILA